VTSEQYARAKEHFIDLVNKSVRDRESRLKALSSSDPEVANEVRGLLAQHFSRTIMEPTGKVSKTTVQSKSISTIGLKRISYNLVGGVLPLASALGSAMFLIAVGWYLQSELIRRSRAEYATVLSSMAEQKSTLVLQWAHGHELRVKDWGRQNELQLLVKSLDEKVQSPTLSENNRSEILLEAPEQYKVKCVFENLIALPIKLETDIEKESVAANDRTKLKYAIWNRSSVLLADWQYTNPNAGLGGLTTSVGSTILKRVFDRGASSVELPRPTAETISEKYPMESEEQYAMFIVPIFSPDDKTVVIGAMMVRSPVFLDELEGLLSKSVLRSSNTYLLDDRGAIATNAMDLQQIRELPAFTDVRKVRGSAIVEARDPGGNILANFIPSEDKTEWSWTKPGKSISQPKNGIDVNGYRDYRGRDVVGAWNWIEPLNRLLVLEIPKEEAFKNHIFIDRAFKLLYGIPILISLAIGALSLRRAFRGIELMNRSLGSYILREKIGEGGLGIVYRAEHKLLGRTAAIKLIKEPLVNSASLKRFEREVRMAAKLSHPNTVSIYDFGMSKDGLLYCAMELVDGVNLAHLIGYNPAISLDRCLWIMRQICGAIEEAHEIGLIHRDIKPQNIMICHKGQLFDLIKVVDFGLAKTMADNVNRDVTATRVLIGTPGFIAPERLETPWIADPRIDIFAYGVLSVYLMTGKVPILGVTHDSLMQLLNMGRFSEIANNPKFNELVRLLAQCIAPDSNDRPRSMSEIGEKLASIATAFPWSEALAERWWQENEKELIETSKLKESTGK
jgi:eukaryotic-like serine/threonine-protein kinase